MENTSTARGGQEKKPRRQKNQDLPLVCDPRKIDPNALYTQADAAAALRVGKATLKRFEEEGMPAGRAGGRVYYLGMFIIRHIFRQHLESLPSAYEVHGREKPK